MTQKRILGTLLTGMGIILVINVAHLATGSPSWSVDRLFSLDREINIPTWFSVMMWALAALFAYRCSLLSDRAGGEKRFWTATSVLLLLLSCDEGAMIHETVATMLHHQVFNLEDVRSKWVVYLGPVAVLVIGLLAWRAQRYLKGSRRAGVLLGAGVGVFVLGAFVLEATINFKVMQADHLYAIESAAEETLEMTGTILIIAGLMRHESFLLSRGAAQSDKLGAGTA